MKTTRSQRTETGSTIAMAMLTIVLLGGFVALAVDYTNNIGRNAQRDRVFNNAVEIGDGCISEAFAAWRQYCKASSSPNPATTGFTPFPSPSPGNFPSFSNVTISNYSVQACDALMNAYATGTPPEKVSGPGSGTYSYFYLASADVTLPALTGTLTAKVRRVFEKRYTSPWNWAMMYNNNLELHPSASLTLNGWVHTNQDTYVGNGDASATPTPTLTLTDRLTYQGNYNVGFDPNDGAHAGQVNVAAPNYPSDLPPGHEQYYSMFGWDTTQFNTSDGNSDNNGYREMIEKPATPWVSGTPSSSGDPFKDQRLYNQASTVVEFDSNNNMTMTIYSASSGNRASYTTAPNGNSPQANAWTALVASVHPGYAFNDFREGGAVRVINFDVAQFNTSYVNGSGQKAPYNGIVYIRDSSTGTSVPVTLPGGSTVNTSKRGVRVINGASVPSAGITIVSDNPVYVQGDFNTGRTAGNEPPSNTGTYTDPDVSGYTRKPSSIMGDAITLLSNSWSDANAGQTLSSAGGGVRTASNTTVNAALVSGNVPSSGSNYSGGGENFVRFLEDWTGKSFTYYGSMLNLYSSTQGTGLWGNANAYYPPQQYWYFDDQLSMDSSNNPVTVPGYISTVAYLQQQRWYLQY
jgi:hypothetical protein